MAKALILALLLLSSLSCQSGAEKHVDELAQRIEKLGAKAQEKLEQLSAGKDQVSTMTAEEFAKLNVFEYKVVEIPKESESASIEQELGELGSQRWDCFYVLQSEKSLRLLCKRRPETYLRYIPRMFPF